MKSLSRSAGKLTVYEIVLLGMLGGLLVAAQLALAWLPNIEIVSLLLIVYTRVWGVKSLFPLYVFVLCEGLIFGFGIWWFCYLYVWLVPVLLTLVFKKFGSTIFWAAFCALFGLFFGALCSVTYLFIGGISAMAAFFISGIPFDLLHCAGNAATGFLILPLTSLLMKIKKRPA